MSMTETTPPAASAQMASAFAPFSLTRLLDTVFRPRGGERVAILIDLDDPRMVEDFAFLNDPTLTIQRSAHDVFYQGLRGEAGRELGLGGVDFFAYRTTGGSNLDLPESLHDPEGRELSFREDLYPSYELILCISTYSATAPLTAAAKEFGFRGSTMHGLNDVILATGLAVDYEEVSVQAEKLRLGMTRSERAEIDFEIDGRRHTLTLHLGGQVAQKSHGLCRGPEPDVANLPAGEVYFVPTGAEGEFPMKYEDGTLGLMKVAEGRIVEVELIRGDAATVEEHRRKLAEDPVTGEIGELGFGTQVLPFSGRDIQDEKVLGTVHVATGRSDHLGGTLTPELFKSRENASHDDILFAPHKTPEIRVPEVRIRRDGQTHVVIQGYRPAEYLLNLLR